MNLTQRDAQAIWHPFTQHATAANPVGISRGKGAYLFDENNHALLDLISSWWVNLHGHAHPTIAKAIYDQAMQLEHVIFAGFTHEPAVQLAENLLTVLPSNLKKVFYSDNGSTAIEVALKMAYQFWYNQGQKQKQTFIAFERGYHGDTFGAMALGKSSGYFHAYENFLFEVKTFAFPQTWHGCITAEKDEQLVLRQLENYLAQSGETVIGMLIEPLIQGAGGMRMCRSNFLVALKKLCQKYQVLLIFDEVMTGFYRTGEYFAATKAAVAPDIMCLAKGITGGFLPLAATVCTEAIYAAFLSQTFQKTLVHGHSYTANPLGCAAGLASLKLLQQRETQSNIKQIVATHEQQLQMLASCKNVKRARQTGTIAAFELSDQFAYASPASQALQHRFAKRGLLIRPLGNVIYLMPPFCITPEELIESYTILMEELSEVTV